MTQGSQDLERVRSELRRLGYLTHRFDRFLLQDALRPARPGRTLGVLAVKVGVAAGGVLALAGALVLAAVNGNLAASPWDVFPLVAHLLPPTVLGTGGAFLALGAGLLTLLRLYPVRWIGTLSLLGALVAGGVLLALPLWHTYGSPGLVPRWGFALALVLLPAALYVVVRVFHDGLLSLAIRRTELPPERRMAPRFWLGLAGLVLVLVVTLAGLAADRTGAGEAPASLPWRPGERVLLVGIDGVLADELEYLLARGDLPAMDRLRHKGGVLLGYRRPSQVPAAFWTTVATGLPGPEHGVTAVDSFRPLGVRTPLAWSGPFRPYWSRVEVPLGLSQYRPLLSNRRRAFAVWELAARGGTPVLVVNWWGTFPVEPLPGLVLAHGAYQLLGEEAPGVLVPEDLREPVMETWNRIRREPQGNREGASPWPSALWERAILPDRFYRAVFQQFLTPEVQAAALYLPALDIAAEGGGGSTLAFADLLREELGRTDELLASRARDFGTVVVVVDPGRRSTQEGRILLWRRRGCGAGTAEVSPEAVAAALLRALGLPQSARLPEPPPVCPWEPPPARISTYGKRDPGPVVPREGREYLESLRSLGYL